MIIVFLKSLDFGEFWEVLGEKVFVSLINGVLDVFESLPPQKIHQNLKILQIQSSLIF